MPPQDELLMMFPGNYTWSAAVRGAIGASIGGGGEIGEIYKVVAALKAKPGDNAAWFEEWNKMGEKVALLAKQAEEKGHLETAAAAYMRAAHYIQIGERLRQPRTAATQKAYARSVELFRKGAPNGAVSFYRTSRSPLRRWKNPTGLFCQSSRDAIEKMADARFFRWS